MLPRRRASRHRRRAPGRRTSRGPRWPSAIWRAATAGLARHRCRERHRTTAARDRAGRPHRRRLRSDVARRPSSSTRACVPARRLVNTCSRPASGPDVRAPARSSVRTSDDATDPPPCAAQPRSIRRVDAQRLYRGGATACRRQSRWRADRQAIASRTAAPGRRMPRAASRARAGRAHARRVRAGARSARPRHVAGRRRPRPRARRRAARRRARARRAALLEREAGRPRAHGTTPIDCAARTGTPRSFHSSSRVPDRYAAGPDGGRSPACAGGDFRRQPRAPRQDDVSPPFAGPAARSSSARSDRCPTATRGDRPAECRAPRAAQTGRERHRRQGEHPGANQHFDQREARSGRPWPTHVPVHRRTRCFEPEASLCPVPGGCRAAFLPLIRSFEPSVRPI